MARTHIKNEKTKFDLASEARFELKLHGFRGLERQNNLSLIKCLSFAPPRRQL